MVNNCLSNAEKALLKNLIGKNLDFIKSQKKDAWNMIFGNLCLVCDDEEIEIRNELIPTEYFGEIEDVSRFFVKKNTDKSSFALMVDAPIVETKINKKISDIIIIQDEIHVKNSKNKVIYEITIDTAIVLKLQKKFYVISRDWSLEEELRLLETDDYKNAIYSEKEIIAEWSGGEADLNVICNRKELLLKEKSFLA